MAQQQNEWVDVEEDDWEDVSPIIPSKSTTTKSKADRSWYDTVFSAPKFLTDAVGDVPEGGFFDAMKAVPDVARGLWNNPLETIGGGLKGMAQGAVTQLSPANIVSTAAPFLKPLKSAAPFINAGLGAGQFAQGVSDVMEGNTSTGLGNIGFGALGIGTAGLPKFGSRGKLAKVADSIKSPDNIIERNGIKYKQTGVNPDTGNPTYEPLGSDITNLEVIDELGPNASGESAASLEAISRQASMATKGQQFVVFDKAGNKRPLIGPEAVDYKARPGETYGILNEDGTFQTRDNQGGKVSVPYAKPLGDTETKAANMKAAIERRTGKPISEMSPTEITKEIPQKEIPTLMDDSIDELDAAPSEMKEGLYRKVSGTVKTLLTSYDMSAPGRQGKGLITHPEFWKSLNGMRKAWGSKKAFDIVQDSITNDLSGYFKPGVDAQGKTIRSYAEKVGLDLTDLVSNKEEVFKSSIAEKYLPGVQASQRAYVAFLNKTRADVFKKLINQAKKEGRDPTIDLQIGRDIANSINVSTGRGRFGKLEESTTAMKVLNETFFAPKLAASRVQMYTRVLNPKTYTEVDPIVRKEALRSLFGIVGTATMVGELARLGGAQVSNDPTNTDFRKIKIGNTRIDNLSGLQQYGVSTAKFLSGKSTSSISGKTFDLTNPKFGGQTRADIVTNFLTNKLAPIPSLVWAWTNTKEFDGEPFEVKQALVNRTVPIIMQDLYELYQEDPSLLPLGILPFLGEGIQTYGR